MLTASQIKVSEHVGAHALVRAVAGSGKTTTLVALVKKLVEKGVSPQKITFVVFNKDAKEDIKTRILESGIEQNSMPKVHTFHSLAYSLYVFLSKKGFIQFNRLETNESFLKKFSQRCLNEAKTAKEKKTSYASKEESEAFINFIDIAKSTLLDVQDAYDEWIGNENYKHFVDAFYRFETQRINSKFITFSDLIRDVVFLCKKNNSARNMINNHVGYLLMDEVQDINEISIEIAKAISSKETKWIMVGDVDQCIYSWRGAEPEYLSCRLKETLSREGEVIEYDLPETFRYGNKISLLANFVVSKNKNRSNDICISAPSVYESDFKIEMHEDKGRFGKKVTEIICKEKDKGTKLSDIAILVRLFSFSSEIELELLKNNIPYELEGGSAVFKKREVNALVTLLKISQNKLFEESDEDCSNSLNDLFTLCFFGHKISVDKQTVYRMKKEGITVSKFLSYIETKSLTKFKKEKLMDLITSLKVIEKGSGRKEKPDKLLSNFVKFNGIQNLLNLFSVRQEDYDNKIYTINSFISFIKGLESDVATCLDKIEYLSNIKNTEIERVKISSIHRSKGREWPVVILPGLEDGLFPYTKKDSNCDIESERRLFYVGTTRCIKMLYYVCPKEMDLIKMIQGRCFDIPIEPLASRFIYESQPFVVNKACANDLDRKNPEYNNSEMAKRYIEAKIKLSSLEKKRSE